jgi:hypothetical protein
MAATVSCAQGRQSGGQVLLSAANRDVTGFLHPERRNTELSNRMCHAETDASNSIAFFIGINRQLGMETRKACWPKTKPKAKTKSHPALSVRDRDVHLKLR